MLLFHGTSRNALSQIIKDGRFNPPTYLTNCPDQANHYARLAAKHTGSEPCVLIVETGIYPLSADFSAFDEPLETVWKKWARTITSWSQMLEAGIIPSPSSVIDYRTSLHVASSAFIRKPVPAARIYHAVSSASHGMLDAAARVSQAA